MLLHNAPLWRRAAKTVDQNPILWYTFLEPEWRNRQTRATQNRVGLAHVGSIPTSGT
jgi:hypothetical protein